MSDTDNKTGGKTLSLSGKTLSLKPGGSAAKQSGFSNRGPSVAVEVRRTRKPTGDNAADKQEDQSLTNDEREARARALQAVLEGQNQKKELPKRRVMTLEDKKAKEAEEAAERKAIEDAKKAKEAEEASRSANVRRAITEQKSNSDGASASSGSAAATAPKGPDAATQAQPEFRRVKTYEIDDEDANSARADRNKKVVTKTPRTQIDRRGGRLTVAQALSQDYERDRGPSLAAQKRAREKARLAAQPFNEPTQKMIREVVLPETITVQELSNRMAETGKDVIKALMKMGVMATASQIIDADTAELLIVEFGHKVKRVTDADVEIGLGGLEDTPEQLMPRAPVVTIMGHVDHGKTSLLDALRATDVVSGEAGGITQHIGAYQVQMANGQKITFLDTPGHEAFTEMRARGANVTDIVVIVVAANDSIMPQTVEAINHAKAAKVPIIVAINKIDLPDANSQKVKNDLLMHELVIEDLGGDIQCIEISAKKKINLDKLEEAILLQAEILELKANPNRQAIGYVIEAKMERGRGSVATILIQNGTLRLGDIFVAGAVHGRVRAIIDDKGKNVVSAIPGQPVEVLGSGGTPFAGDAFNVTDEESKAREIAEYRLSKIKEKAAANAIKSRTTMDDILEMRAAGEKTKLQVIIRADVQGSVEAIIGSLHKMVDENEGIAVQVLHSGVGGITESDIILAKASNAFVVGFNVRANAQARDLAEREKVNMRYYNIIYNVIDDAKAILTGMLSPTMREEYLGQALIKQVFNITKVGKVAGCEVKIGSVKRGAKVRLLRDNVVIHEGKLKTLQRFKDEVKEVKEGTECGMAFENYDDIKDGDIIECYEVISEARKID